jgi:hypothetical protein
LACFVLDRIPPAPKPTKNTATIVSIIMPFCIRPFSGDRELKSPNCFSKSSQSRLFILKSPLGRRGLDFGKRAPGAFRSLNGICSKAGRIKIISGARRTVIAHWDTFARAGDLFPREHLKQHVPSERWLPFLCSPYYTSAEVRKREDEYRQLASDILQRASEEQSAVLQAQWKILSASYIELAGQSKKVEENDAQYDPIPWDRLRRH